MSKSYEPAQILNAVASASAALSERKEEINRLNVFPVPDGDTGTNMSLTLESVINNVVALPPTANGADARKAIIQGALMGARGNSGVITSQILRGLCEGSAPYKKLDTEALAAAFKKSEEVAFQAVRKPVEGTILTVLRDAAKAAAQSAEVGLDTDAAIEAIVAEAYASVKRTPELLPVLKENNVVDAGGFGLAILLDAFAAALTGKAPIVDIASGGAFGPKVEIEQIDDWDGSEYRYCNEFLVNSDSLDTEEALDFLQTMGDCELCVGAAPNYKVHVHSNNPDQVLKFFLDKGQISEVHIHNMDLQSQERNAKLAKDSETVTSATQKAIGFVAVAPGAGNAKILESLGVDVVVSGGHTMNPSTKDLLDAVNKVPAQSVIILPNNSNIILAAESACSLSEKDCGVVPTKSVPQAFAALFAASQEASLEENVLAMTSAASDVKTGEITTAIKDSKDANGNPIKDGDVIGIADGSIEAVGSSIKTVMLDLLQSMEADDYDTLTFLAGEDLSEKDAEAIEQEIEESYPDLEIDMQRGEQPLYPVVFSLE